MPWTTWRLVYLQSPPNRRVATFWIPYPWRCVIECPSWFSAATASGWWGLSRCSTTFAFADIPCTKICWGLADSELLGIAGIDGLVSTDNRIPGRATMSIILDLASKSNLVLKNCMWSHRCFIRNKMIDFSGRSKPYLSIQAWFCTVSEYF